MNNWKEVILKWTIFKSKKILRRLKIWELQKNRRGEGGICRRMQPTKKWIYRTEDELEVADRERR